VRVSAFGTAEKKVVNARRPSAGGYIRIGFTVVIGIEQCVEIPRQALSANDGTVPNQGKGAE
jgi:hypothetical protein